MCIGIAIGTQRTGTGTDTQRTGTDTDTGMLRIIADLLTVIIGKGTNINTIIIMRIGTHTNTERITRIGGIRFVGINHIDTGSDVRAFIDSGN